MSHTQSTFTEIDVAFGRAFVSPMLAAVSPHLFTTRDLTLRGPHADDEWTALETAMAVSPSRLFAPKQVHRTDVLVVASEATAPASLNDPRRPHADVVMTDLPDTAVAVQVADCVPLLLADRRTGAVAAAHAGWRGTAAGVARRTIEALGARFGTRPHDVVVAIGPAIGPCCYQVGPDVCDAFLAAGFDRPSIERWFRREGQTDRFRLDVPLANREQLIESGVRPESIELSGLCTACHPALFFSYRRDGAGTGRLAAAIRCR